MTEEKHFPEWIKLKEKLHTRAKIPKIKDGDIWWCSVGENVGIEINGKSEYFSRPVLILKKLSRYGFLGIPLTSQHHSGPWYINFKFQEKQQIAVLAQARTFSVFRLHNRIGAVSGTDLELVRAGFQKLYF